MWRPSQPQRPPDASAYDYNTRYNLQATEDSEDTRQGDAPASSTALGAPSGNEGSTGITSEKPRYPPLTGKRPNYRPTPLKWPFIACVAAAVSVLIALVVVARARMPNSDTTAKVTVDRRAVVVEREPLRVLVDRRVVETRLMFSKREEIGDAVVSSLEAAGTPVVTLPPDSTKAAAALKATAPPTPTALPSHLRPGVAQPGQVVLEVPMEPCGGKDVCTTLVTTDVIQKTIIQPPEVKETVVTVGSTTNVTDTTIIETVVVGGTAVTLTSTTVTAVVQKVLVPIVVVEDVTPGGEPVTVPTDETDSGDGETDETDETSGDDGYGEDASSSSSSSSSSSHYSSASTSSSSSSSCSYGDPSCSSSFPTTSSSYVPNPPLPSFGDFKVCASGMDDNMRSIVCTFTGCPGSQAVPPITSSRTSDTTTSTSTSTSTSASTTCPPSSSMPASAPPSNSSSTSLSTPPSTSYVMTSETVNATSSDTGTGTGLGTTETTQGTATGVSGGSATASSSAMETGSSTGAEGGSGTEHGTAATTTGAPTETPDEAPIWPPAAGPWPQSSITTGTDGCSTLYYAYFTPVPQFYSTVTASYPTAEPPFEALPSEEEGTLTMTATATGVPDGGGSGSGGSSGLGAPDGGSGAPTTPVAPSDQLSLPPASTGEATVAPSPPPPKPTGTPPKDKGGLPPRPTKPQPPPPPPASTTRTSFFTKETTELVTTTFEHTSVTGGTTFENSKETQVTNTLPVTTKTRVTEPTQTYFSLGKTTIEVTYTPAEQVQGRVPVTHFTTLIDPGETVTGTIPGQPVAVVSTVDEVQTQVVNLAPQTFVTRLGPTVANVVITVTPTPAPSPGVFQQISMTVVTNVGGTPQVTTVQDAPQTVVTNVNGVDQTVVTTPPPRTVTNQVGGTLTTFELVTTPTAGAPLTFTVVTTIDGELTTIVTTPLPSTIVTTISGRLTTFLSTPPPTTFTSVVRPSSTKTIASIENPDPSAGPSTAQKVYDVDEGEYFVGKFLPTLLAIMLAIVLRIIDLNAKLYQPFYALNQEGGALGSNSMTLHYSGLRGFVVPFSTLLQGHPVPFITTMVVWCSSLLVPLATEGLGLKLHGECSINNVSGCAADLGISPGPMHALLALMALIVTLLLVLIYFLRNWETGLHANPWSVAGITSLTRSRDVRIRTAKRETIRKDMAEKRYQLGWFRNENGDDEYGIVLHDEAGRFLASGSDSPHLDLLQSDDSDDDFVYDADGSGRRRRGDEDEQGRKRHVVPFIALSYAWRIAFMLLLGCLFILVLYYHVTRDAVNDFTLFMKSQSFGVRFLFSGIGVAITFAWIAFFVSKLSPSSPHLGFPESGRLT
jgi:hypothetical protein